MKNINNNLNIQATLDLLDSYLKKKNILREFVVGGGAAVELLGAKNWLNEHTTQFNDRYPIGWELRVVEVFQGKALRVLSVGKRDLVFSKIIAELDRGFDKDDIIALAPTESELDWLEKEIPKAKSNTGHLFEKWEIDQLFAEIRERLDYDNDD